MMTPEQRREAWIRFAVAVSPACKVLTPTPSGWTTSRVLEGDVINAADALLAHLEKIDTKTDKEIPRG